MTYLCLVRGPNQRIELTFRPVHPQTDTLVPVFWKGKWMWMGNMGSAGDWRDFQSLGTTLLEEYGK